MRETSELSLVAVLASAVTVGAAAADTSSAAYILEKVKEATVQAKRDGSRVTVARDQFRIGEAAEKLRNGKFLVLTTDGPVEVSPFVIEVRSASPVDMARICKKMLAMNETQRAGRAFGDFCSQSK